MPRLTRVMLRIVFALIAFVIMISLLLFIAYSFNIYTPPPAAAPPLTAITGVTLIDASGTHPLTNTTIIIGGDKVLSIEQAGSTPKGAHVIDVEDLFALPGLIDAAVFFEAPASQEPDYLSGEWAWEITRSVPNHRRNALDAGITTVLDLGSGLDSVLRTRSLLSTEELAGPRLLTSGPVFRTPNGYPNEDFYPSRLDETTIAIRTAEEARQWVQELASRGVNIISVSFTSLGTDFPRLDSQVLTAIVDEAHVLALPVVVHTSSLDEARKAIIAGADALLGGVTLEGEQIDDELLALMVENGTVYIPALAAVQARQPGAESLETAQSNTRLVFQAGIQVIAGSGTAGERMDYGRSLQIELGLLTAAGLSTQEAIMAATSNAAHFLGLHDLGRIAKDQTADLIILDSNPLENTQALSQVQMVIQNGAVVVNRLTGQ